VDTIQEHDRKKEDLEKALYYSRKLLQGRIV